MKVKKKSQPNFLRYVKKIETQAKNGFLIKKCLVVVGLSLVAVT